MIVIDACSIILLAKATVLEDLVKWKETQITKGVYKEVMEGKEKKFIDALILEKLVKEEKIILVKQINEDFVKRLARDLGLGVGEAESIVLATENKDNRLITDNKQGRKTAKIYGIDLVGSIEVVTALFKVKKISKEKALVALRTLKEEGWFQDYLIEEAVQEVKNG